MTHSPRIRVGIGGWTYAPWRDTFYPHDLTQKAELHYASRKVTAIEINGTFYRLQTPATFAKWRDETSDGFIFSVKAPRHIVSRRNLADGAESIRKFIDSGLAELGPKLGPIMWQLPPTKAFDATEIRSLLSILPAHVGDRRLTHALEARHPTFRSTEYLELAREHSITTVYTHDEHYPQIADVTGEFVYVRLRQSVATEPTGYAPNALALWAERARTWARGEMPADLPYVEPSSHPSQPRDVFIFFINGAKERAPAAAQYLLAILQKNS